MAKKTCETCKKTYPAQLDHCPHCKAAAETPAGMIDLDKSSSGEIYIDAPGIDLAAPAGPRAGGPAESDEIVEIDWSSIEDEESEHSSVIELGKDAYVELDSPSAQDIAIAKHPGEHPSSMDIAIPRAEKAVPTGDPSAVPLAMPVKPADQAVPAAKAEATALGSQGKATKVVAGTSPATHLAGPPDAPAAAEAGATGSSAEFNLGPVPTAFGTPGSTEDNLRGRTGIGRAAEAPGEADQLDVDQREFSEDNSEVDLGSGPRRRPTIIPKPVGPSSTKLSRPARGQDERGPDSFAGESSAVDLGSNPEVEGVPPSSSSGFAAGQGLQALGDFEEAAPVGGADDELVVVDDEEPAPKARKKRSGAGALVGGLVGVVVASAAWVGLWFAGIEPPAEWRGGTAANTPTKPFVPNPDRQMSAAPGPRENLRTLVDRGDFVKALEAPADDAGGPEQLAARGEARWRAYLAKSHGQPKADDPAVAAAKADLEKAGTPEATLWLGQIQEGLGDLPGARQVYQDGLNRYQSDERQARHFKTALSRLDALTGDEPAADEEAPKGQKPKDGKAEPPAAKKYQSSRRGSDPAGLALVLLALLAEQPAAGSADAETPEAGESFWQAVQLARQGKYEEAVSALDRSVTAHKQRRFTRQNKSQNPTSDPAEQIFIKACQELEGYWTLRKKLADGGYLDTVKNKDAAKALDRLIAAAKAPAKADDAGLKVVIAKLKQDKDVTAQDPEVKDVGKSLDVALAAKKQAADQLAGLKTALTEAKYLSGEQADPVKGLQQLLQDKKKDADALAALKTDKGTEKLLADKKVAEDRLKDTAALLQTTEQKLKTAEAAAKDADAKVKTAEDKAKEAALVAKAAEDKTKDLDAKIKAAEDKTKDFTTQMKAAGDKLAEAATRLKTAEDTLKAVAGKLAEAKVISPDARGAELVKGAEQVARLALKQPAPAVTPAPAVRPAVVAEREPVVSGGYDPLRAEQYFSNGLTNFYSRRYGAAEGDFRAAARAGQDARYLYFLGLAQAAQGKEGEAQVAFRQASTLERDGRPGPAAVDASLERIQGPTRRYLDAFRR